MKIQIHNQTNQRLTFASEIKKLFAKVENSKTMHLIFIEEDAMLEMNNYYRHLDYATDVLSFPSDEEDSLGDIFICRSKAKEQAHNYYHSLLQEVAFLSVHGYLHLLGYDHQTPQEEQVMMQKAQEILNLVNLDKKGEKNGN
ncbi:MAG: rRNA maturation RNase YbeY [Acholeplasmatales bacterium]|jgi:probable rRNA maturation factor|nr:rRNA maturation RNase YbeY [Acholeplasmatales bacterium]